MSHFSVLVVGEDVEKQLAPFHEFECTGVDDEFVKDVDVTEECRKYGTGENGEFSLEEALSYHGLEDKTVADESEVDREDTHKYGYAIVRDGELIKAVNRTNPDKQWDWYLVGGRWSGFFKMKPDCTGEVGKQGLMTPPAAKGYADSALKKDIDFDFMRDSAGNAAAARWDKARELLGDTINSYIPWPTMRDEIHKDDLQAARTAYAEQPATKALSSDRDFIFASVTEFLCDREKYIQSARDSACTTFAVLKDGIWYERGSMGWWGIVSDEKDKDEWCREFSAVLDSLPDDTRLTVVDCHI